MFCNTCEAIRAYLRPNVLSPLESAELIYSFSSNVKVDWDAMRGVANGLYEALCDGVYSLQNWRKHPLHPKTLCDNTINWIFLVDSLNFSFWADEGEEYAVTWRGVEYKGYWALCALVNRALDQGIPMTDPTYYGNLTMDQVKRIFKAHRPGNQNELIDMPMIEERAILMRQHGEALMNRGNNFAALVVKSKKSTKILMRKILDRFPSFRDEGIFNGKRVGFYKRAQILIADIYACYEGKGLGYFYDIDDLTAFADYRVPQVLYFYDVLFYQPALLERIVWKEELEVGERDEIEIRAATIYAVDKIVQQVKRLARRARNTEILVNSVIVDFWLWDSRRMDSDAIELKLTHHRVRSIFY